MKEHTTISGTTLLNGELLHSFLNSINTSLYKGFHFSGVLNSAASMHHKPMAQMEAISMLVSSMAHSVYAPTQLQWGLEMRINALINVQETVPLKGVEV